MFSFFTYPHQLAAKMRNLGFRNEDMPVTREWIGLVHSFRKAGYAPDRASVVIAQSFWRNPEALAEATSVAGAYAIHVFGR